jgi:hypothetical protein
VVVSLALIFGLPRVAPRFFSRFGTITSLYGLSSGIIDRTQFSLLVAVIVGSAIVPTVIAQRFYAPSAPEQRDITAPVPPAALLEQGKVAR